MAKPWNTTQRRGAATANAVVMALAAGPDPGPRPTVVVRDGRRYAHYSRTRMYLDRDAWESLRSADDVLVLRIRAKGETPYTVAFTEAELARVFGSVRETRSWDEVRCYHFPTVPAAVASFRVR